MRRVGIVVVAIFLAVGCGSDDDQSSRQTGASASITKAEYIERIDKLCVEGNRVNDAYEAKIESLADDADLGEFERPLTSLIESAEPIIRRMAEVPVPRGEEKVVQTIRRKQQEGLAAVKRMREAVSEDDLVRLQALVQEYSDHGDVVDGLYKGFGHKVCGSA